MFTFKSPMIEKLQPDKNKNEMKFEYIILHCKCLQGFAGKVHSTLVKIIGKHYSRETTIKLQGKSLIVMGKIVYVIGQPHNLFRESL